MSQVEAVLGDVLAPRIGAAWIDIGSRRVLARNALNVRTPPGARVIVVQDPASRTWLIVGRER